MDAYAAARYEASPCDEEGRPLDTSFSVTASALLEPTREAARALRRKLAQGKSLRRDDGLGHALTLYARDLGKRRVVKAGEVLSLLRRELLTPFGERTPLDELTHARLVAEFRAVENEAAPGHPNGRPGTARELRTRTNVFLAWCKDEGLLPVNVLAGSRRQRRTRAEQVEEHGRALEPWELPLFWAAASRAGSLGAYLQLRLLCGQRRSETAAARWQDISLERGVWEIPRHVGKTRALVVPLPPQACALLTALQPAPSKRTGLVFPGRRGTGMSGWSKSLLPVYADTAAAGMAPWTPGDLRKTFRSGLSELGVSTEVAELMVAHGPREELVRRYDRSARWQERCDAAQLWCNWVEQVVRGGTGNVLPLAAARGAA